MSELPACPFCGSDDVDPAGWLDGNGIRGPECMGCGATAPSVETWNRRHVPVPEELAYKIAGGDAGRIMEAIGEVAQQQGGITKLSATTGMSRTHLHRLLSPRGRPRIETLLTVLDALDLQMEITGKQTEDDA